MASRSERKQSRTGVRLPLWGVALLALIVVVVIIGSSIWLFRTVQGFAADSEFNDPDFGNVAEAIEQGAQPVDNDENSAAPQQDESFLNTGLLQPWSGHERVTILLLGIDQRCDEEGPTRTDTMMVLTIDPVGKTAAVLSLPRDLWVEIPGFGVDKINQANFKGEVSDYPGGGPALAVETVESALGVSIDYYATVNFDAFVRVVDEINGIDVIVSERIEDDTYPDNCYGYDPFYLDAGNQHLDGQQALKYARTRATFGGDVDRAIRQQQVVMAVRDKILRLDMIPQLLAKAPQLWRIFQDNVQTNLTFNEAVQLGLLVQDIPAEDIRAEVLDFDYVYDQTTPDGQQVLIPIRDKVRTLRNELFAPPAVPTPVMEDLPQLVAQENAQVAIFNGTTTFGLAAATQSFLESNNINVAEIGNADAATYRRTQIIDYGSHPSTTTFLVRLMDLPPLNVSTGTNPQGAYDLLIILGSDWEVPGAAD
ncbi:MAG: LCP family protein [Candidatus Promineifilaceae bacterium]|nr:LCP family protein [Candidatus Promineifilaceae bacterium]